MKIRDYYVKLMGGCCAHCKGVDRLIFHHRQPSKKQYEISYLMSAGIPSRIEAEIGKCVLLCTECHADVWNVMTERHRQRRPKSWPR